MSILRFQFAPKKERIDEKQYINALLDDLKQDIQQHQSSLTGRPLHSIFIGGGTPSLFSPNSIQHLIQGIETQIEFNKDIEITLEANPGSSEAKKFHGFRDAGINRLSIGTQSFNNEHLNSLGRIHNGQEAIKAAQYAAEAGFSNFNLDLMFGLPSQTIEQSLNDVAQAIALSPTHLSCYQLTIEPNTLFHHQPPITPDDETLWEMQTQLQTELKKHNYHQYEVSAYAQPNLHSRHNTNYWQFGDYLGIGAGAHGKISSPDGQVTRYWKIKHPTTYLEKSSTKQSFVGGINQIATDQLPFEFMMNALRLTDGFKLDLFEQRTQLPIEQLITLTNTHREQGLIQINNGVLRATRLGRQHLDSLLQDYL